MAKKKVIVYENIETHHINISESILRNILTKWQLKWENNFKVKSERVESVGWFFSLLSADISLWGIVLSVNFESDYTKAVMMVISFAGILAVLFCVYKMLKAYRKNMETLDVENLIKDIEKRTE